MSQGMFSDTLIRLEAFKRIFKYFIQKSTFFEGVSPGLFVKIDQIFKLAFFTFLRPWGSRRVVKLPWESILSLNKALTKNFLFNSHLDFIFCGIFLCAWSLGRPQKCLRGRFKTNLFDWKLLKEYLVQGFWSKLTKFSSWHFSLVYVSRDLGVS